MKTKYGFLLALINAPLLVLLTTSITLAAPAPDANSVLILGPTDTPGAFAAEAAAQGFTTVVASAAEWATYTEADFATFRAILLGDPHCRVGTAAIAAAEANRALWSAAVGGPASDNPKLIVGTDEEFHKSQGGAQLITSGIEFVTSSAGETGLYVSLSCYYNGTADNTPVPVLDEFGTFGAGAAGGCFNDSHIVASHPALEGLTDESLSGWGCSVHNVFNTYPAANFIPLAIAEDAPGAGSMDFPDGSTGIPYILASGEGVFVIGERGETIPVPILSGWALLALAAMLGLLGMVGIRRLQ